MTRPALALPSSESWTALAQKLPLAETIDGLERFDLLALGSDAADRALRVALEQSARVHAIVLAGAAPPADRGLAARLALLTVPVLVLLGTRDSAVPPETGRRWRAVWPGCHVVFVFDAGRDIARDRPEAVADVVLDFLADPGAFLVNRLSGVRQP